MAYVIGAAVGIVIGFLLAKMIRANRFHKDVAGVLLRCLEMEEAQAAALGKTSMIDYVVEEKGMDYAIVHYGNIYHILRGIPQKEEKLNQVEEAIGQFLQHAMRKDIERYRQERTEKK